MIANGFIEQRPYRLDELSNGLGCDMIKAKDILNRLILAGVVRTYQESMPEDWVDETLQGQYNPGSLAEGTRFFFRYVGIIDIDGHIVKCYPKFIRFRSPCVLDLRLALNAIERYNNEHTSLTASRENADTGISNRPALALRLLRDYFTYGLYSNQREELTLHGHGEIDWETTVNTTMPMIRDDRPYYFDYFTNDTIQDDTDYITRLHSCVITECSRLLHTCELDEILLLETPMPYQGDRTDFGDDDYICQRLQKEINVQFITHKQSLLRDLLAWIQNTKQEADESGINLFGTNSFHTLWEAMCAEVFESQYKRTLNSLGITLKGAFADSDRTLEELIPKPRWKSSDSAFDSIDEKDTLRPDYIRIVQKDGKNYLVILDAKYYNIEFVQGKVRNNPGVEDICKQHLYQLAFKDFIETHSLIPVNAFVSPLDEDGARIIGTVEMPILTRLDKQVRCIKVLMLSANDLLQHYIDRRSVDLAEFSAIFQGCE